MIATDLQLPIELEPLRATLKKYGVVSAKVFGSYARGQAHRDSDLDLIIKLDESCSIYNLIGLRAELEANSHCRVDVATQIHPRFEPYITPDLVTLL